MEDLLQVGAITQTHGIRGEVKVFPLTDDVGRFKKGISLILDLGRSRLDLEVETVKFFKQFVILKFKGYDSINEREIREEESVCDERKCCKAEKR